jgi:hypothetical protein
MQWGFRRMGRRAYVQRIACWPQTFAAAPFLHRRFDSG